MRPIFLLLVLAWAVSACKTSTIESRRQEKSAVYASLTPEVQRFVDQGQIRVGMPTDAVYIAWGPPQEVLESEGDKGHLVTWQYHGTYVQETRFWNYREVSRDGTTFLDRFMDYSYDPRDYVRAEIVFQDGKVKSWRTLGKPVGQ